MAKKPKIKNRERWTSQTYRWYPRKKKSKGNGIWIELTKQELAHILSALESYNRAPSSLPTENKILKAYRMARLKDGDTYENLYIKP